MRKAAVVALAAAAVAAGPACASYRYYGLTSSVEPARLDDAKLQRLPVPQRVRAVAALSTCDGVWEQIYAIKSAEAASAQRWRSASLLVTALGTVAIAAGELARNRTVTVDRASGRVDISDPAAARWVTGVGLLTTGIGATGAFVLSMRTSEAELERLNASLPQIEGARDTFNAALSIDDPAIVDRQITQLEELCSRSRQRLTGYDGDTRLAALYGSDGVRALGREVSRKVEDSERRRAGAVMDTVAAGRRFEALARSVGFSGARLLGEPWQVGAGGQRLHAIGLRALEPELKKLGAAGAVGRISVALFSPDDHAPPAFTLSVSLVGGDRLDGSEALLGRMTKALVAPAVDFEVGAAMTAVASTLALAPYTRSLPAELSPWICRLGPAPLIAPMPGPTTLAVSGCPALMTPATPATVASLRAALHLPALPAAGPADDRLLVRIDGLGPSSPGPALASLVWLEGRPVLQAETAER